jgi:hypothetical protein
MSAGQIGQANAQPAFARAGCAGAWLLAALLTLILAAPGTAAASRTDTVLVLNGDRLHGEVRGLSRGQLEFSTASMSTVFVEWDHVVEVTSSGTFEIVTTDDSRYLGTLAAAEPGKMGVVLEDGRTLLLDFRAVVRMRTIRSVWWQRLSGNVNLGASYTQSSGIGQGTLTSNVTFRRPSFEVSTSFDSTVSVDSREVSSSRTSFRSTYVRRLPNRWFLPGIARFDRNPDLGFDLRTTLGGGAGRFLWQSTRGGFALGGGLVYDRELPLTGESVNNVDGFISAGGSFVRHTSPETNLQLNATAFPSLSDSGRFRFEMNGTLSHEIINDFTVGMTLYTSYDNRPPSHGARTSDVGGSLTLGWSF